MADPKADKLLGDAISSIATAGSAIPLSIPVASTEGRPATIVNLLPVRGASRDLFFQAASIMVLMPVGAGNSPSPGLLQGLFDLTPTEARVAKAIGEGLTLAELAQRLGVSRETVRSHLGSVFRKTGTTRQSTLAILLGGLRA